jgi:hypothetical protein
MNVVSEEIKGAVVGFVMHLCKGMLDDDRWDWDVEKCDWRGYQEGFLDSTILRTTMAVFLNTLRLDEGGNILNYTDAIFRAAQYFRALVDPAYPISQVIPKFTLAEMEEPDWYTWG